MDKNKSGTCNMCFIPPVLHLGCGHLLGANAVPGLHPATMSKAHYGTRRMALASAIPCFFADSCWD